MFNGYRCQMGIIGEIAAGVCSQKPAENQPMAICRMQRLHIRLLQPAGDIIQCLLGRQLVCKYAWMRGYADKGNQHQPGQTDRSVAGQGLLQPFSRWRMCRSILVDRIDQQIGIRYDQSGSYLRVCILHANSPSSNSPANCKALSRSIP